MKTLTKTLVAITFAALTFAACSPVEGKREIPVTPAGASSAFLAQTVHDVVWAVPNGMDLDKYPIVGHVLTKSEQINMKLRLGRLDKDTIFFNEDRGRHAFTIEVFKKDTEVWFDEKGEAVYKTSCGNRIMTPEDYPICPFSVTCPGPHVGNAPSPTPSATTTKTTTPTATKSGSDWDFSWVRNLFLGLLALAFLLACLMLLAAALYRLFQLLRDLFVPAPAPPTPPVAPVVPAPITPTPAPVTPVTPAPTPVAPVPAPTVTRRFGPFKVVSTTDQGANGYLVHGDGRRLGIFQARGRTEDAGVDGHYFVMEEPLV